MSQQNLNYSGKAVIISAPSGSGKTTIAKNLLTRIPELQFSVSACTRSPREGKEKDGVDYYFISVEEFKNRIREGKFIEWEEVYNGMYYGTLESEIQRLWSEKKHILFDVDVKGGVALKKFFGDKALAIFIKAPSLQEIEERLRTRGTENEEALQLRIKKIVSELEYESEFDETVINATLDAAIDKAAALVRKFLAE